jgi:hypothetical protein
LQSNQPFILKSIGSKQLEPFGADRFQDKRLIRLQSRLM